MPPVTLDSVSVGKPTKRTWANLVKAAIDYLNTASGSSGGGATGIPNGSFETGSGADTAPSGWALSIAAGNSTAFDSATPAHGKQAFTMTNPGAASGGVTLSSLDFQPCAPAVDLLIGWWMKFSVATTTNAVQIHWYDKNQSSLSVTTIYSGSSGHPTSWREVSYRVTPPANAVLFKLEVVGVNSTTAGTAYWDGFSAVVAPRYKRTVYLSGSGTHTYEHWAVRIVVTGKGGGGGGASSGTPTTTMVAGADGGDTTLGAFFTARGGNGAPSTFGTGNGGAGGPAQAAAFSSNLLQMGSRAGQEADADFSGSSGQGLGPTFGHGGGGGPGLGGGGDFPGGAGAEGEAAEYKNTISGGGSAAYAVGSGGAGGNGSSKDGENGGDGYLQIEEFSE